jgi:acyl-CoA thioester hydrolase
VVVVSDIGDDRLSQLVCLERGGRRTVFAEVVTTFGDRRPATAREDVPTLAAQVRRGDLDTTGHVRLPKVFELFQEARVLTISSRLTAMAAGGFVVGSSDVSYREPIPWRTEAYSASAWVARIGRASFEIRAELSDGTTVLADSTTVLVGFDLAAQSSRTFSDEEREQLASLIPPG